MKAIQALALAAVVLSTQAVASGDPVSGERKATACMACHGNASFPGIFPLVQLGGRDADKLATKTNKYRSGKLISPMMNMAVMPMNDQDVADVSAYYQKLGKPFLPMSEIRGDQDLQASLQ